MRRKIDQELTLTDEIDLHDLEGFLGKIWGTSSPLSHVSPITDGTGDYIGKALYVVIVTNSGEIVACTSLKFVDTDSIEAGSLAVDPEYRGRALSKYLFTWCQKKLKPFLESGFHVVTYATLGSKVMDFIMPQISELSSRPVYPLNIALGIVPVEDHTVQQNIHQPHLVHHRDERPHTSPLSISTKQETIKYHKITRIGNGDALKEIMPVRDHEYIDFAEQDNLEIDLSPIMLKLCFIRNTDASLLPSMTKTHYHQLKVPALHSFEHIHDHLSHLPVVGFSFEEDILHINYANVDLGAVYRTLAYLKTIPNSSTLETWVRIVEKMNEKAFQTTNAAIAAQDS
jgi:GNAT superfamily N-acetyltransferase